jgi:hypothetical protein
MYVFQLNACAWTQNLSGTLVEEKTFIQDFFSIKDAQRYVKTFCLPGMINWDMLAEKSAWEMQLGERTFTDSNTKVAYHARRLLIEQHEMYVFREVDFTEIGIRCR